MSLILEALKKLEREKAERSSPIVTAGEAPWRSEARSRSPWALAALSFALVALGVWLGVRFSRPAAPIAATATPANQPGRAAPIARAEAVEPPSSTLRLPAPPGVGLAPAATPSSPAPPEPARQAPPQTTPSGEPAASAAEAQETAANLPERPARAAARRPIPKPRETVAPETAPPPGEPRLQAIAERDGRRVAMIDDRMLYEGDRSGDLLVIRIGEDEVEVEVKGQRRTLRF